MISKISFNITLSHLSLCFSCVIFTLILHLAPTNITLALFTPLRSSIYNYIYKILTTDLMSKSPLSFFYKANLLVLSLGRTSRDYIPLSSCMSCSFLTSLKNNLNGITSFTSFFVLKMLFLHLLFWIYIKKLDVNLLPFNWFINDFIFFLCSVLEIIILGPLLQVQNGPCNMYIQIFIYFNSFSWTWF